MIEFLTDPVLRAPTIGSMLMCFASALGGVLVFLRKESLVGEALSHATYPGVIGGLLFAAFIEVSSPFLLSFYLLGGAFFSALLALYTIHYLERKWRVSSDAALCFVLSTFFGLGITLASYLQTPFPALYRHIQVYLYGQVATMTDIHIVIYALLSFGMITLLLVFYKELQAITLDRHYAKSLGIPVHLIDALVFVLLVSAIVIGIRSVGVVLMSAMLIAPAVGARQFSEKLTPIFFLAGLIGLLSGFLGNFFSVKLSLFYADEHLSFPTGPMIVLVAALFAFLSLLLAPERGLAARFIRGLFFRWNCLKENLLKELWHTQGTASLASLKRYQQVPSWIIWVVLHCLVRDGWIQKNGKVYTLTHSGHQRAQRLVRLHRLWEVYLVDYMGMQAEKVHRSAEEMEHIITPQIEQALDKLLHYPRLDPHHQPIPQDELL